MTYLEIRTTCDNPCGKNAVLFFITEKPVFCFEPNIKIYKGKIFRYEFNDEALLIELPDNKQSTEKMAAEVGLEIITNWWEANDVFRNTGGIL